MITCAANGCPSSQTTKIDGKPISFFPFPEDDLRKNQWLHNCNLASGVNDKEPMHLCEVHFERVNFTPSRDLKPSAVPTLFGRIEEPPRKRKAESILQVIPIKSSYRQKKLDEQPHTIVTPPENPFMQLTDNVEDSVCANRVEISMNNGVAMNGSFVSGSMISENCETNTKLYRLTIQIDKVRGKPGPRCKKLVPLITLINNMKNSVTNEHEIATQLETEKSVKKVCTKGNCKLRKCIYNSKPAFQCELCKKYYVTKKKENQDDKGNSSSLVYPTTLSNPQLLNTQIRKYFICDICQIECNTQMKYDKHVRLHVSTNPSYPYKCHQCSKIFELKERIKQHYSMEHPKIKKQNTVFQVTSPTTVNTKVASQQNDYLCTNCNITFNNDQAYRNHCNSHKKKDGLRRNISETNNIFPVPNPLSGSQIGILQPVKFSCNVCSKQFDNVGEVDIHTRTHLEYTEEDHKCNICKKFFKSGVEFGEHLKHHLSRAHPCPICSKAFINRTTLKIHLKTHGES